MNALSKLKKNLSLLLSLPALIACIVIGYLLSTTLPIKSQNAYTLTDKEGALAQEYPCPNKPMQVHIGPDDEPRCKDLTVNGLTQFHPKVNVSLVSFPSDHQYRIVYAWGRYFCPFQSQLQPGDPGFPPKCFGDVPNGDKVETKSVDIKQGDYTWMDATPLVSNLGACGYYQADLSFTVYDITGGQQPSDANKVCSWGGMTNTGQPGFGQAYWTVCQSNNFCSTETPTPTVPTATPTVPTATPTVPTATPTVPTATPTVPTATPTVTPTSTITPTSTLTPTGTLTPTASPTVTNTPVPSATPTPTTTPGPTATNTPTTTVTPAVLPSTGAPVETWATLFGLLPLGAFLRKFAKVSPKKKK